LNTAIKRTKPSTPLQWLYHEGLLDGKRVIDYGCGHGADVDFLDECYIDAVGFDPWWRCNFETLRRKYDAVLCIYVLNTIEVESKRYNILDRIRFLLKSRGKAYIVVRRDVKENGRTSRGWQGNVDVPIGKSIYKTSWFEIYEIRKNDYAVRT